MPDVGSGAPRAHPDWPASVCPNLASLQQSSDIPLNCLAANHLERHPRAPTPTGILVSLTIPSANLTEAMKRRVAVG
jgi:hypothetical protein